MNGLVLASRSPARARLLADAGVTFTTVSAEVDEEAFKTDALRRGRGPREIAAAKALHVAGGRQDLVIGADQTLELDGRLFDKPANLPMARAQLLTLRGRTHQLHAAVALARDGQVVWRTVESVTLQVRPFSQAFLEAYLAAEGDELLGCVGAYRLEGWGVQLFERIEGDYFTVLGLPLLPLLEALRAEGRLAA